MSEKVLSQDEIDALFSAMSEGQIDTEPEESVQDEISPYDLASRKVKLLEQFDVLEEVHDKFAGLLRSTLSSRLRVGVEADFISTEMIKFGEFIKNFSKPTNFNIFNMDPLTGSALLVIADQLVFSLIDCVFGGSGKPVTRSRDFTMIEQRIMRRISMEILKSLEKSWEIVHSVRVLLTKTESNPDFIHLFAPNDLVMVVGFSVSGNEFSGNIFLCIPYIMIEPIKDKLSYTNLRVSESGSMRNSGMKDVLNETRVTITVELGRATQTIGDILGLRTGDVISLGSGPRDPVSVKVEKVPKYRGIPGVVKGNRAVRISTVKTV